MISYINNITGPYVEHTCQLLGHDDLAIVIMDSFKGQVIPTVFQYREAKDIHQCLLPLNTTDCLQPMNLNINKAVKFFLKMRCEK